MLYLAEIRHEQPASRTMILLKQQGSLCRPYLWVNPHKEAHTHMHTHSGEGEREPALFLWMGIQNADIHASFPVEPIQPKYQVRIQVSHRPKTHHEVTCTSVKATNL